MSSELIIHATQEGSQIALLENKQLVEFHEEKDSRKFDVGDIYLSRVRKVIAGLNAAFVDIGHPKDAFLHYLDLGIHFPTLNTFVGKALVGNPGSTSEFPSKEHLKKEGHIQDALKKGDLLLVQVKKTPISQKGPRVSCQISLSGRYLILLPFGEGVSISRRISREEERMRLMRLVQSICPKNFGVILRTAAEGVSSAELHRELRTHLDSWEAGIARMQSMEPKRRVIGEVPRSMLVVRDMLDRELEALHIEKEDVYQEMKAYICDTFPKKEKIVHLYTGESPIFEAFGVAKQLRSAFGRRVRLPGGGSLIMEQTEALYVVDVNSGKNTKEDDQESNAFQINLHAAAEVARQIRLRDLGGIIVIDFIDMKDKEHKTQLYNEMKVAMARDHSKHTLLPLTRFGLMQLTRHRVRPAVRIDHEEKCPTCEGTGKVENILGIGEIIEQHVAHIFMKQRATSLRICLHPYLYAYFTKGVLSKRTRWYLKYKRPIRLVANPTLGLTNFQFYDSKDNAIDL